VSRTHTVRIHWALSLPTSLSPFGIFPPGPPGLRLARLDRHHPVVDPRAAVAIDQTHRPPGLAPATDQDQSSCPRDLSPRGE
jgi:hypothetical protein